jgi:hypothetical protein
VTGNKGQNLLSVDFKTGKEIRLESFQVSLDFYLALVALCWQNNLLHFVNRYPNFFSNAAISVLYVRCINERL